MFCVAIDPGSNGGIAEIDTDKTTIATYKMPETTEDICSLLDKYRRCKSMILLESQHAMPTAMRKKNPVTGKEEISVVRGANATWTFAQHYGELRGILTALEIPFVEYGPKDWMRLAGIRKKNKGESQTEWKNFLRSKAQERYPGTKVTLAVADALLMADVCHRFHGKSITKEDPFADI